MIRRHRYRLGDPLVLPSGRKAKFLRYFDSGHHEFIEAEYTDVRGDAYERKVNVAVEVLEKMQKYRAVFAPSMVPEFVGKR